MSRHRSPAGRNAHHGPAPERVAAPGARPRPTHDGAIPDAGYRGSAVALLDRGSRPAPFPPEQAPRPAPAPFPAGRAARPPAAPRPAAPAPLAPGVLSPEEWESQHALHVPPPDWSGPRVRGRERARHAAPPAVRNGLAGAAATGTALAVVVPALAALPGTPATGTESLTLAAAGIAAPTVAEAAPSADPTATVLLASIAPVLNPRDDLPPGFDTAGLIKSVDLQEAARAAEEARLAREAQANCDADLDGLGRVQPFVRDAARFLSCLYDEPTLIGVAGRARVSDHPRGLAVDFMTRGEQGDRIADCALANREALGISYVIWKQRVNYGDGWERMADRGSDTENHYDHVHVSFERGADGAPLADLCG